MSLSTPSTVLQRDRGSGRRPPLIAVIGLSLLAAPRVVPHDLDLIQARG